MSPQTVFLHIGLHKTGTTYLQNVFRANREQLRAQDVEFPGGPGEPAQALTSRDGVPEASTTSGSPVSGTAWSRMWRSRRFPPR